MFSAFFGQYLLNKGIVTGQQLNEVLNAKDRTRLKLGVLAINSKYMTAKEVELVHQLQETLDRRFGEIAVVKGFLTDEQLADLLSKQKSEHLILAQALIDAGIMDMQSFESEISRYKEEAGLDDEQFEAIKNGDIKVIMTAFLAFEKTGYSNFYIDFVTLFVKNLIRFVDSNVFVDRVEKVKTISESHFFKQNLKGTKTFMTGYSGKEKALLDIASQHAGEVIPDLGEYAIDSASEFLNLSNGLFVVNKSDNGEEYDLTVQEYLKNQVLQFEKGVYKIPITLPSGTVNLYIGEA